MANFAIRNDVIMELQLHIKMNPSLYVRDPESSSLGKSIISRGVFIIHEIGFEEFTFKKLAKDIGTTEASIYRYFENKHKLLTYLTAWFWTWMEYQLMFSTNNITDNMQKMDSVIKLLTFQEKERFTVDHIDEEMLHRIVIAEGNKAYLTKHVNEDNKALIFKPYKDLCHRIACIFMEYNDKYEFPHSLASTLIETAHHQFFFKDHLPALTDFGKEKGSRSLARYLKHFICSSLQEVE